MQPRLITRPMLAAITLAATIALLVVLPANGRAEISFRTESGNRPYLFESGMVLQRGKVVPVWGTATPSVAIRADFVSPVSGLLQSRTTASSSAGGWVVRFDNLPVGGPYEVRFFENGESSASVVLADVLVGDVWLLSGQSNMVLHGPRDGDAELYPQVRAITVMHWGQRPSGPAFYFGAELSDFLDIPIGLVNRAVPDTALGHWLPSEVASDPDPVVQSLFTGCGGEPVNRCLYYDESIRPLERPVETGEPREGLALRGVVWWQGEKGFDKRAPGEYAHLFPAMMRAWRSNLGQPDLPFVYNELPSGTGLRWLATRVRTLPSNNRLDDWQAQQHSMFFRTLAFPLTALMTSIDLVGGIHPKEFDVYGRRLGDAALGTTYAGEIAPFAYSGPIYESASLEPAAEGPDEVRIRFRAHTADGLKVGPATAPPGAALQGFALCCNADGKFVFADARIENDDEVVVSDADVPSPTIVNYAIGHTPMWANLFNGNDLGAAPFSSALQPFVDDDPDGDGFWEPGAYTGIP
ncbi:MAG TPA: sialate O-acetylesterase [Candidatus Limnocylindrales bacterium]|nr:sialate O-acetylesterase [Candidatus Limnocylindrales bacterium]